MPRRRDRLLQRPALSRGLHFNRQSQTRASNLVLKCQSHELGFVLTERLSKAGCSFWTDSSSALLDIAKVCPRYSKKLRIVRKTLAIRFPQARQGCP
jgi:hypothetical protein